MTSINISASITKIGERAFYECSSLKEINVAENNTVFNSIDGVLFNKEENTLVLYPCAKDGESYVIPDGIKKIGNFSFNSCSSLTNISIPASVTNIGSYAFQWCSNLTSIDLPSSLMSIGVEAFYYCPALTSIKIPNNVTKINEGAFNLCFALKTVYYEGTEENWSNIIIGNSNEYLLAAERVLLPIPKISLEDLIDGTEMKLGKTENGNEILIVPTVQGDIAITEADFAKMLNSYNVNIVSNNGVIGTGSKLLVGEQEAEIAVKGDIDGDGIATVFDALMVKKALANNGFENEALREFAADADGTEVTDSADADAILAHIVGNSYIK